MFFYSLVEVFKISFKFIIIGSVGKLASLIKLDKFYYLLVSGLWIGEEVLLGSVDLDIQFFDGNAGLICRDTGPQLLSVQQELEHSVGNHLDVISSRLSDALMSPVGGVHESAFKGL